MDARVMVRPGFNPHNYDPTPQQISALAGVVFHVRTGMPFEKAWMKRIRSANPGMPVLDAREGRSLREMEAHTHNEHGLEAERHEASDKTMRTVPKLRMVITTPPSTEDYPDGATILSPSGRYRSTPCDC